MPEETIGDWTYATSTIGSFEKILRAWKPEDLDDRRRKVPATEKGWERSLVEHLRLMLPWANIIPQGGSGMKHGDIVVERAGKLGGIVRDIVELKLGLPGAGTYQRLVGQVDDYRKEHGNTVVVICGEGVDPKLIKQLETRYPFDTTKLGIFWKNDGRRGVTQRYPRGGGNSLLS